jgi:hypothetical protein
VPGCRAASSLGFYLYSFYVLVVSMIFKYVAKQKMGRPHPYRKWTRGQNMSARRRKRTLATTFGRPKCVAPLEMPLGRLRRDLKLRFACAVCTVVKSPLLLIPNLHLLIYITGAIAPHKFSLLHNVKTHTHLIHVIPNFSINSTTLL